MITNINSPVLNVCLIALLVLGVQHQAWSGPGHASNANEHAAENSLVMAVFTDHNEHTELFVEFAPLVVGQPSVFIAHFTRLDNFRPIEEGELTIYLQQNDKTLARFRVTQPARQGIFMPAIEPRHPGRFQLVFELKTDAFISRHDLGEVEVFTHPNQVKLPEQHEGEITYLKEQQWQQDFALTQVSERPLRKAVTGFAQIQPPATEYVQLRAPSDGYFLTANPIFPGQTFKQQSQLGVVVPRLTEGTDLGHLQVALHQAQTKLALAQADLSRMQSLYEKGAVPQKRLFEAQKNNELARVEQQTAQARLNQQGLQQNLTGIELLSPIEGQIIAINVRSGELVKAGDSLLTLASPYKRWLSVQVPEKFSSLIKQPNGVWFQAQNQIYTLDQQNNTKLVSQGMMIDPKTRTLELIFEYSADQAPNLIGARYPVHVYVEPAKQRLSIPASAVIDDNGFAVVYVQETGESFSRRPVRLGVRDAGWVEVLSGVKNGERVVSQGAYFVKLASSSQDEIGHGHAH
ncbi:efflux RND transporter periplasmic adaptor subunit [Thiomicrospira sp. R3]|uniref:efflux RND transporter periplasmic adaptor subunit n=1 Tax=Thiomicrospira sp. R3 TaxID=3035472 RepID=UPI00259B6A27|nr:efflux RND transporter periplasmic adaptor subunit [Thiomicrospira sp. R3]WFE67717.1 efflux RND transporter periplasmic adaptor subunit [Thiomicrospira sp. R3]